MNNNRHILYTSCLCSRRLESEILKSDPKGIGIQVQKYHRLLARGFAENGLNVDVLSFHKAIEKLDGHVEPNEMENDVNYHYILDDKKGYMGILFSSFTAADNYFKNHKDAVMVCDVLNFTVSMGAALAARKARRKVIGIITDFPEQMSGKQSKYSRLVWMLIRFCTGYVILTEQMKDKLNSRKPTIVLEGHVDSQMKHAVNSSKQKYGKKVCLYAGMLHRKYGIETLVKAFSRINRDDIELHIYGDGDYVTELNGIKSDLIRYFGIVPNETVVNEELKATLLVNPRPTEEIFTKYSFPSKNMEYMASGTPLLTTKLPGMPVEYLNYVYTFDDESIAGMTETLERILSKSKEELHAKGAAAQNYVLKEKNETVQAKRMLETLLQ